MAGQEDTCWQCGASWAANDETPSQLRVLPGGASTHREDAGEPRIPIAVGGE
jgi:hypothetical protein